VRRGSTRTGLGGAPRAAAVAAVLSSLVSLVSLVSLSLVACGSTVDSVGYDNAGGMVLHPISGPASYPNPFHDLLGKSDTDINNKIAAAFAQLFHGDASTQAIYFPVAGTNQAYIQDILHGDIRTEGIGLGMLIAVELNKQDEFDHLWSYAKANLEFTAPPDKGYFSSSCDAEAGAAPCTDPFGMEQFLTALVFAHDRWGTAGASDAYSQDALGLLEVFRHIEDENGGIVGNVTNAFDDLRGLPYDVPDVTAAGRTRPSIEMPGYYELWAQAAADPFWSRAAASTRAQWQRTADPTTGLLPVRATFDGDPIPGSDTFQPESYRTQINMVLDTIWTGAQPWEAAEANRLLGFFSSQGIDAYGTSYTLKGIVLTPAHDPSLVAVNGMTAAIATTTDRATYVDRVWNMATPSGVPRYYSGILDMLALLALGGQLKVW
jgi:oligosaccharide reducing-end xylanase